MIGIFDSGLGGLTALKELRSLLPSEPLIYFGDTGRVPYGTRSAATIVKYAKQDAAFLLSQGVDAILVACGTVSTTALKELRESLPIPVIGVVDPTADAAVKATKNGKIAVIGTPATIRTSAFEAALRDRKADGTVISLPCPLFVPLVESGFTAPDCEITRLTCEHYLAPIRESGADTLILGCTHYPLLAPIIASVLPGVTLISSGAETAKATAALRGQSGQDKDAPVRYYVSDDPSLFTTSAGAFLGYDLSGEVEKIDIERY